MKIPDHEHVFLFNEKITVHCSFSHDSDEETGERPKLSNMEIRREAERLRILLKRKYFGSPPSSRSF